MEHVTTYSFDLVPVAVARRGGVDYFLSSVIIYASGVPQLAGMNQ